MNLEWQCENLSGEWVTEKFEAGKMPSPTFYTKAVLMYTQPLETLITFVVINPAPGCIRDYSYWAVSNG